MQKYHLQSSEVVLFKGDIKMLDSDSLYQLMLTNHKIVFVPKSDDATIETFSISDIKSYEGVPQIKHSGKVVEIYFLDDEKEFTFVVKSEQNKFINETLKLISKDNKIEGYTLEADEYLLYKANVTLGDRDGALQLVLTDKNVIFVPKARDVASIDSSVEIYPTQDIKVYKESPQVVQKDKCIEVYFTSAQKDITFASKQDATKFNTIVTDLLTGKTGFERTVQNIKDKNDLLKKDLDFDAVGFVKDKTSTLPDKIWDSVTGGIGKGITKGFGALGNKLFKKDKKDKK